MTTTTTQAWAIRIAGFFFTVLGICVLGALLGALIFPVAGTLGGSHKTRPELIVLGVKTGGFFFLVWAPGFALVRLVMRAAADKKRLESMTPPEKTSGIPLGTGEL